MTLSEIFKTEIEYICPYFDEKLKDPTSWTFPVTNFGIDEVQLLHKKYTLWEDLETGNNIGRFKGNDKNQILKLENDIDQNGIDSTQPPIFVNVEDNTIGTGNHRQETSLNKGIAGWMVQYYQINCNDPVKKEWINKRFTKQLNNGRLFNQLNNSIDDIRELIKYGIKHQQLTTQPQIEREIEFQSNNSLTKAEQKRIIAEMVSYVHTTGANVKLDRFRTFTDTTYREYVDNSTDSYVKDVINDPDSNNYYINIASGTSIRNIIGQASKITSDSKKPWLNIQASVEIPSSQQPLEIKRNNVHDYFLPNLKKELNKLFKYKVDHECYPWEHPNCQHAFPAQDHTDENPEDHEFIRYQMKDT